MALCTCLILISGSISPKGFNSKGSDFGGLLAKACCRETERGGERGRGVGKKEREGERRERWEVGGRERERERERVG